MYAANQTGRSITTITAGPRGTWTATKTTPLLIALSVVAVDGRGTVYATSAPTTGPTTREAARLAGFTQQVRCAGGAASFNPRDYKITRVPGYIRVYDARRNVEFCAGTCTDVTVGRPGVNGGQAGTGYCIGRCTNVATGANGRAGEDGGNGGTTYCLGQCTNIASGGRGGKATGTTAVAVAAATGAPRSATATASRHRCSGRHRHYPRRAERPGRRRGPRTHRRRRRRGRQRRRRHGVR